MAQQDETPKMGLIPLRWCILGFLSVRAASHPVAGRGLGLVNNGGRAAAIFSPMRNPGEGKKESERKGKGNEWDGLGWQAALLEFHIRSEGRGRGGILL